MVSHGILNFNLVSDIIESSDIYAVLEETISVIYCMRDNLTSVEYAGDFFEQESSGISFADWLYDYNSQPELRDMKKELSILINKGIEIDSILYQTYLQAVDKLDGNDGLIMTVCRRETNVLYVSNISQYWKARQWYLSRYVERSGFVTEAAKCFPNLYFHNNVFSSFNTLKGDFARERPLIVRHLQALDSFRERFVQLNSENTGYREICAEFEAVNHIECSPQASRNTTRQLRFSFYNRQTEEAETLRCELHTKLKWTGMDRENQNRIYFHPGTAGIEDGKVLIVHIGCHL